MPPCSLAFGSLTFGAYLTTRQIQPATGTEPNLLHLSATTADNCNRFQASSTDHLNPSHL